MWSSKKARNTLHVGFRPGANCMCPLRQGGGDARIEKNWHSELGSHSSIFGQFGTPKWPGNCNPSDEKTCRLSLAHFEALELSYPKMTFPGTFWKVQNLEIQVQIFENQVQMFEYQVHNFEHLKETSRNIGSNRMSQVWKSNFLGPEIENPRSGNRYYQSRFSCFSDPISETNAQRARFKTSKN